MEIFMKWFEADCWALISNKVIELYLFRSQPETVNENDIYEMWIEIDIWIYHHVYIHTYTTDLGKLFVQGICMELKITICIINVYVYL